MGLKLKDKYGRVIAEEKEEVVEVVSTGQTAIIDNKPHKRVSSKKHTGYAAEEDLAQMTEETVEIPASFAGLEAEMVPTRLRDQLFEITDVVENDGYVEVTALHIFYRQRMNSTVWEPNETTKYSGAAACRNVLSNAMFDLGFNVASDCTDTIIGSELDYARMNIVEAFLNPESGICAKYDLSLIRDNDVFYCLKNVGYDRGFVIQSRKNLLGVERTESIENVVTRVAPVGRDEDGNFVWMTYKGSSFVDSPHIGDYATPRLEILYTGLQIGEDGVTAENIQEKLYQAAQKRFTDDKIDIPEVSMTVRFISLGDTEEYAQYRDLDKVYLYDILHINEEDRGYSYSAQVVGVQHNILTGRLESVTIGTPEKWDGVRKVATWRIPEISGTIIRQNTIREGVFHPGAIKGDDIKSESISGNHFSAGGKSAIKSLALEQLIVENTSEDGLLHTRFAVVEGMISSEVEQRTADGTLIRSEIQQTADQIYSAVSANNSSIYSFVQQTASNILTQLVNSESGLYHYINQTAEGTEERLVSKSNQTWIQDKDPRTEAGGSHEARVGDIWVESTHQGTWDGAEGFDWEHDEDYDWTQIQGAKVWGWQNGKWELISDQQQVVSYSDVVNTAEYFVSRKIAGIVNDEGLLDVYMSKLEQTATEIKSDVSNATSTIYSFIHQTSTNVLTRVAETPRSVVSKTAPTSINNRGLREGDVWVESEEQGTWEKALNYSWSDDSEIDWNKLRSNKYHIYRNGQWDEILDGTLLLDDADIEVEHNVAKLYARQLEYTNGELQRYYAELSVGAKEIKAQVNEYYNQLGSSITQTAREIRSDVFSDNSRLYSYISQTSSQIRLYVANEISDVSSSITQTASQIRSEVNAANSSIRSSITQTASSIRAEVRNTESRLASSITQTAGQIRSEVAAAESTIHSSITQTASQIKIQVSNSESRMSASIAATASSIRSEVYSTESNIRATIKQTADSIRSDVSSSYSKIYSYVQQTASSIRQEVGNAISGVNSSITQTANSIRSDVNTANSKIYSFVLQTESGIRQDVGDYIAGVNASITTQADRISLVVEGTGANAKIKPASIVTAINNGASSVIISASHINLDGYVKATDLTTDYFSNKISNITNLLAQNVTVNWLGVKYNGTTYDAQYFVRALKLEQSGNTYTLSYARVRDPDWTVVGTFSRATSLSGEWSGSSTDRKTYIVSASPQGNTNSVTVIEQLSGSTAYSNFSGEFGTQDTSGNFTKRGSVYGYLILGGSGSSSYVNVNTKSDGTGTNVARLSVGSLYTSGKTAGHDSVIGDEISLGSDQAYNGALTKKRTGITGYIWLKKKDGTWVRLRDFSIGLSFNALGYKSAGTTITAANHYYYWSDTSY